MSSENVIQQHVVKMLESYARPDVVWFAVPNGEFRGRKTGVRLKKQGVRAGVSDLVFLISGHFHGVELKTFFGAPSPAQIAFSLDLERAGGTYHLCHGLAETLTCLRKIGVFPANISFDFSTVADSERGVRDRSRPNGGAGSATSFPARNPASRRRSARI